MKNVCSWITCLWFRSLERMLPVRVLTALLWPFAALRAAQDVWFRPDLFESFDRLPVALRPSPIRSGTRMLHWKSRLHMRVSQFMCIWPDRLNRPGWTKRFQLNGIEHIDQLLREGHAVILAGLHLGPIKCIPHILRARQMQAATLANMPGLPVYQNWVYCLSDEAYGLHGVPRRLRTEQLREVVEFLKPGRVLYMAIDGVFGKRMVIEEQGVQFDMSTGFMRIAQRSAARIVPCAITTDGPLRFTIHFGTAIPMELLVQDAGHRDAGRLVLRQLLPWATESSHQFCTGHLRDYHAPQSITQPLWQSASMKEWAH